MPIDRRGTVRGADLHPVPRNHAADDPQRAVGRTGEAMAAAGYEVLDRANPRGWDTERQGVARPVHDDGPNVPYDERTFRNSGVY